MITIIIIGLILFLFKKIKSGEYNKTFFNKIKRFQN